VILPQEKMEPQGLYVRREEFDCFNHEYIAGLEESEFHVGEDVFGGRRERQGVATSITKPK
jgi:hypothetical protein